MITALIMDLGIMAPVGIFNGALCGVDAVLSRLLRAVLSLRCGADRWRCERGLYYTPACTPVMYKLQAL